MYFHRLFRRGQRRGVLGCMGLRGRPEVMALPVSLCLLPIRSLQSLVPADVGAACSSAKAGMSSEAMGMPLTELVSNQNTASCGGDTHPTGIRVRARACGYRQENICGPVLIRAFAMVLQSVFDRKPVLGLQCAYGAYLSIRSSSQGRIPGPPPRWRAFYVHAAGRASFLSRAMMTGSGNWLSLRCWSCNCNRW